MEPAASYNNSLIPMKTTDKDRVDLVTCKGVCTTWKIKDEKLNKTDEVAGKIVRNIGLPVSLVTKAFIQNNEIKNMFDLTSRIKNFIGSLDKANSNENWTFTLHDLDTGDKLFTMGFHISPNDCQNFTNKKVDLFSQKPFTFIGHLSSVPGMGGTDRDSCTHLHFPQGMVITYYEFRSLKFSDISKEINDETMDADTIIDTINQSGFELLARLKS